MSRIDIEHLRQWIGRRTRSDDTLSPRHARLMASTLGQPQEPLQAGTALPPLWHWLYFLDGLPPADLGRDGHPARGGFLPPVPLANRMWAGGELAFLQPLPLDAAVRKRSRILSVEHKHGRSGELVFVTVLHEVLHEGHVALTETHDIVYKDPTPPHLRASFPAGSQSMPKATHSQPFVPTSTTLFRYSALTFNGHRIHYDADYCREVEGYENLVIHGPLTATVLAGFAQQIAGQPLKGFRYRGLQPSLLGQAITLHAALSDSSLVLWAAQPGGEISMRAEATL